MLRTLPARSGFLWVLLACIFLAGCTRHPKYSLQTEAALEPAGCGTFPQGSLPAVAAGAERQPAPGGGACPQRRRPGVAPVRRVAELRDLPAGFGGLLRRPPLPAGASAGSEDIRRIALLADIDVWLGRGQLGLAEELFRRIDTAGMSLRSMPHGIRATPRSLPGVRPKPRTGLRDRHGAIR